MSRNLINGAVAAGRRGWRLPAPEIERGVAVAAATMLGDEPAIADAALASGLAEHQLPCLLALAKDWVNRLQSATEVSAALPALVDRVELMDSGLRVSLKMPHYRKILIECCFSLHE